MQNKVLKNKTEDDSYKIYVKTIEYFALKKEYKVEYSLKTKTLTLKKRGSDLSFQLSISNLEKITLDIYRLDISEGSLKFSKLRIGSALFLRNGSCLDRHKVQLVNKRQQLEYLEMVDHITRCLRPNSLNFILDD